MLDLATSFRPHFEKATAGGTLTEEEAQEAFSCIMQGGVSEIELAGFLVALKARGETVDEIAGAVSAMKRLMVPVAAPADAIDVVGTGGDAKGTFNISTATAFVLAGAGVPVAKHGNRAVSSKSGAADVLEKLGVQINLPPEALAGCFEKAGHRLSLGSGSSSRYAARRGGTKRPQAANNFQPARSSFESG